MQNFHRSILHKFILSLQVQSIFQWIFVWYKILFYQIKFYFYIKFYLNFKNNTVNKLQFNSSCTNSSKSCDDTKSILCSNSICTCNSVSYFDGTQCRPRKSIDSSSSVSNECDSSLGLSCMNSFCRCSSASTYFNSSSCCKNFFSEVNLKLDNFFYFS